jgi:hypothetical protein
LADLDLWLALTEPGLSRLNMEDRTDPARRRFTGLMRLGGFARCDSAGRLGVAALAMPSEPALNDGPLGVVVHGYGPGGMALAAHLAERAAVWDEAGKPGADNLGLAVYPAGTRPEAVESDVVIHRPNSVLVAGWPPSA